MRVVFCASEVFPFSKTGGLADVCGALPLALEKLGIDVEIFTPFYRCVKQGKYTLTREENGCWHTTVGKNVEVHFLEHNDYYNREGIYGAPQGDYKDNLDRFLFLCNRTLTLLKAKGRPVDIIHCHDWHTAIIPVFIKERLRGDPFFHDMRTVLTIHNLAYQGIFPRQDYWKLNLMPRVFSPFYLEFFGQINLLKGGIIAADEVTTVSREYAEEIQTKQFGYGLEGVLKHNRKKIFGIVNGLDYDVWDPETDPHVQAPFSVADVSEKKGQNKKLLQERVGLPLRPDVPLLGFVSRLSHQKGVDLLLHTFGELALYDVQIIIQGVGEGRYHQALMDAARRYGNKTRVFLEFGEPLAHQIYAGGDFLLMPSLFEPCGLSQLIAFRYGTIPIAFKTGGLKDTITPFDAPDGTGNGFLFDHYNVRSFMDAIHLALEAYRDQVNFQQMIKNAMTVQFSWDRSAEQYHEIYQWLSLD